MVKLSWADHLRMEANKQRKSTSGGKKSIDFYDTDILEKGTHHSNTEAENKKTEIKHGDENQEHDYEFHEQFF